MNRGVQSTRAITLILAFAGVSVTGCEAPREPSTPSVYFREAGTPQDQTAGREQNLTLEQSE